MRLWDATDGTRIRTLTGHTISSVQRGIQSQMVRRLQVEAEISTMCVYGTLGDGAHENQRLPGHMRLGFRVSHSVPDGKTLASGRFGSQLSVCGMLSKQGHIHSVPLPGHVLAGLPACRLVPDGTIARKWEWYDGTVLLWETRSGILNQKLNRNCFAS